VRGLHPAPNTVISESVVFSSIEINSQESNDARLDNGLMQNVNHCVTHDSTESFDDHEINNEWNIYKEAQETISDIWF